MHLDIRHDQHRVWVNILGCKGTAEIEAFFIADHNDVVKFKPKNGIIPYNGNGVYSFKVSCAGVTEVKTKHVGQNKANVFGRVQKSLKQPGRKVTNANKKELRKDNTVERRKETYDLSKLSPEQMKEMESIVKKNDLSKAMKFYRKTGIGTRSYCCLNNEVLMNMRDALKEAKETQEQ